MGRKSCQLSLSNEGDKCEVFFAEGQVKHATYGSLVGDEAVFKVLRWTGGNFQLDFEGKTDKETTQLNTQGLLMEGLRSAGRIVARWRRGSRARSGSEAAPASQRRLQRQLRRPCPQASKAEGKKRKMSSSMADCGSAILTAAVVTVSDSCSRGEREDRRDRPLPNFCRSFNSPLLCAKLFRTISIQIQNLLIRLAREVQFRCDHRRNRHCRARCDAGGDGGGVRSASGWRGRAHAKRRVEEDSVCGAQSRSLRSAGQGSDSEFAGESCGGSRIAGGGGRAGPTCD